MQIDFKPWIFVKFGKEEYLKELQNGMLYMNTWQYFNKVENPEQCDIFEGSVNWFNPNLSSLKIGDRVLTTENGTLSASLSYDDDYIKIFCLSVICRGEKVRKDNKIFDERMRGFGDSLLVIYDAYRFLSKIKQSLEEELKKKNILGYEYKKINYFNQNEYDGEAGPFMKINSFSYQKEFRIVIRNKFKDPFKLEIESIRDISYLESISVFKNKIEPKTNSNGFNLIFS